MKSFIGLMLVVLVACLTAFAQTNGMVSAKIPFPFYVGDTQYPAGEYLFNAMDVPGSFVRITGSPVRYHMFADVRKTDIVTESKLVFLRDGDKNVLHQVWIAGDNHVHDISHNSKIEDYVGK